MPIDKFLYNVDLPNFHPGPFNVRLKYELKQIFFDRKLGKYFHLVYSSAIFSLLIVCLILVVKPHTASNINNFVFGGKDSTLDKLLLAERDIDFATLSSTLRNVSAEVNSALPFLEDDKSYLLHKIRDHENKTVIYVSELKSLHRQKILY